jgi:signal transduction histidine kinase
MIQAAVLLISLIHYAWEAGWLFGGPANGLTPAHHMPVVLYLIPVVFAGLTYGWEGGVLTGLWAGALASINIFSFSLHDFEWILEVTFVVLVIGIGIVMALPVERERRQRQRAEAAVGRLQLLNELANVTLQARTPLQAVNAALAHLVASTALDDAGFALWRDDGDAPIIAATHRSRSSLTPAIESRPTDEDIALAGFTQVPVHAGGFEGRLVVGQVGDPELLSFLSAAANQLAVRVENALLLEQEKTMWASYVALVTEAQEEERRRLARDLHDGPAQQLAALIRTLDDRAGGTSATTKEDASRVLDELRRVARDQRPTLLDDLGIVPALEWLTSETRERTGMGVTLTVEGKLGRLDPDKEVALYRITQEALRNAELHARATAVEVVLRFLDGAVELDVRDEGTGFDVPDLPGGYLHAGRLGLMGMHERAQLVGGSLELRSAPGEGTVVRARIDLS